MVNRRDFLATVASAFAYINTLCTHKHEDAYQVSAKVWMIPISRIKVTMAWFRPNDRELQTQLERSMDQHGHVNPIGVYPEGDHWVLFNGVRRLKAWEALGHTHIACCVMPKEDWHRSAIYLNSMRTSC